MLFHSTLPDIEYPTDLTVWEWAFEDTKYSPLFNFPPNEIAGFTNAVSHERIGFFQVKEHATHLCTALVKEYGLQEMDTVSLISGNTVWYPVAMYAVLRAGGRVNGTSPAYSVDEMTNALRTAKTKYIMTVPISIKVAVEAAKAVGIPNKHVFLLEGALEGFTSMSDLLNIGKSYGINGQSHIYRVPAGRTNDICGYLNFSSGTTGLPKAVMISHKNVIAQCEQLKAVAAPWKKSYLAALPLFHISGLVRFLSWPVASNDECVMLPQFTMEAFLTAIVEYQITDLSIVPPIVMRLVQDPMVKNYDLTCVKAIASGAAPLGPDIIQLLAKKMPWTGFRQAYGMTESCSALATHPPEFYSHKYGNNGGLLLGSTVVRIVDVETGEELGPNQNGEILAKGPQVAMGYFANPTETAETFGADGFLRTGDIGFIDEQGFIHIVDRIKEMIKVKGQQVAPAELEHLLLGHPDVADCAVLGIPDNYSVERPKAYIVLNCWPGYTDSIGRKLIQYVKERRVRYKWLKEIEFVAKIPRNPSGKILRRVLRDQVKTGERGYVVTDAAEPSKL